MAATQTAPVLHFLRRLTADGGAGLPDSQLLERFIHLRDEDAFAALVRRHGPLVLAACRRVMADCHTAEDCFQATFLLLAEQARSANLPRALGPWLYGVAVRTALKARALAARRRRREARTAVPVAVEHGDEAVWRDLRPVLDEAVNRLPEKLRAAFILCYLEGVTVAEAARRLHCPRGTVAARLARARERLRASLVRRGITLGAACLATGLAASGRTLACIPLPLVSSTALAAGLLAAGRAPAAGMVRAGVSASTGGMKAMLMSKLKALTAMLLLLAVGAGPVTNPAEPMPPGAQAPPSSPGKQSSGQSAAVPPSEKQSPADPAAVVDLIPAGKQAHFLSLAEAIAIALEQFGLGPQHSAGPAEEGAALERRRSQVVLNVETAYWNLYGAYWSLYTREQGLRLALEVWKAACTAHQQGRASSAEVAQARGQYELFRTQRLAALDGVLEAEWELRFLRTRRGLERDDLRQLALDRGERLRNLLEPDAAEGRLVPSDAPSLAPYQPAWNTALAETHKNQPEFCLARQQVAVCRFRLFMVRAASALAECGVDDQVIDSFCQHLTGPDDGKPAMPEWPGRTGISPAEDAKPGSVRPALQRAQSQLARSYLMLQDNELRWERFLGLQYRRLSSAYEQIKANRAQRQAFATQLKTQSEQYFAGRGSLDVLLEAQRFWADALSQEQAAMVSYTNARVGFTFAKGTVLQYAQVRAAHEPRPSNFDANSLAQERERTQAQVLGEKRLPVDAVLQGPKGDITSAVRGPTLAALWKAVPPLKAVRPLPPDDAGAGCKDTMLTPYSRGDLLPRGAP
jgi:RNA polymerase sigma factor (sigma-70 family)